MRYSIALATAMLGTPLAAHDFRVVTDIPVAHSLVSMVLGEHGTAELMLDRGRTRIPTNCARRKRRRCRRPICGLDGRA